MSKPYTLDRRTLCPLCNCSPLRTPLVWNATSKRSGVYICSGCAAAEVELSMLAYLQRQAVADA